MARGRMISKSLSTSRKYGRLYSEPLGEFCQALYPLLVAHADDFGRLEGDPYTVKHAIVPASPRTVLEIEQSLELLTSVGLIERSTEVIQVVDFDRHQTGLHKRTESQFPGISGNTPVIHTRTEGKGTELKGTELKGRQRKVRAAGNNGNGHKGPIFQGQRFTVMPFMQAELTRILGTDADAFDLGAWYWQLDDSLKTKGAIDTAWPWLRQSLLREARTRGLNLGSAQDIERRAHPPSSRPNLSAITPFDCPHASPQCADRRACAQRTQLEQLAASGDADAQKWCVKHYQSPKAVLA